MSCPWAKIVKPDPVDFQEIMSEEVARDLQAKEDKKYVEKMTDSPINIPQEILDVCPDAAPCQSDEVIARMLQLQFDKEHDENIKRTENKYNGSSKVSISYDNFLRAPLGDDYYSESEEEEDVREARDWDRFDAVERQVASIPGCGYKVQTDGSVVTKHDPTINGRKNACKMLSFPPGFQTGDGENFDMKLPNKVFNSLKRHSQTAEARRCKIRDKKKERATAEFSIDETTRLLLFKLINQEILDTVNGTISIGKEAVILHGNCNPNYDKGSLPPECAIKAFKTTLSEFKQRDKYIKDDHRFKDRIGNQNAHSTIHLWAEKELHNLTRLKNAKIPCPDVLALKKHVLVMSFIGRDGVPAPKLKDARLDAVDYIRAYDQVTTAMKDMFNIAELVHADLSEYNILWYDDHCVFIDVSQSVILSSENAFHFLIRDCRNVTNFFMKKQVPEVVSPEELFKSITGFDYSEKEQGLNFQEIFKMKPHLVDKPGNESTYNFNNAWDFSKDESVENIECEER